MAKINQSQDRQFTVGDTTLVLRFSVKALLHIKDLWQLELDEQIEERLSRGQMKDITEFLWAASLKHHPEMTYDQILEVLDDAGGPLIKDMVMSLFQASSPPPNPEGEAEKTANP
jgi:hypothetical protein